MERIGRGSIIVLHLFFLVWCTAPPTAAVFIFVDGHNLDGITGRRLLQQKTRCTVNFESANYTIVTSKCKAPLYPRKTCCQAFKELTCPYSDYVNDLRSDCSVVFFSYLNAQGNYPSGLFSNMCSDIKEGIDCTGFPLISSETSGCGAVKLSSVVIFLVGLFMLSPLFF